MVNTLKRRSGHSDGKFWSINDLKTAMFFDAESTRSLGPLWLPQYFIREKVESFHLDQWSLVSRHSDNSLKNDPSLNIQNNIGYCLINGNWKQQMPWLWTIDFDKLIHPTFHVSTQGATQYCPYSVLLKTTPRKQVHPRFIYK